MFTIINMYITTRNISTYYEYYFSISFQYYVLNLFFEPFVHKAAGVYYCSLSSITWPRRHWARCFARLSLSNVAGGTAANRALEIQSSTKCQYGKDCSNNYMEL